MTTDRLRSTLLCRYFVTEDHPKGALVDTCHKFGIKSTGAVGGVGSFQSLINTKYLPKYIKIKTLGKILAGCHSRLLMVIFTRRHQFFTIII